MGAMSELDAIANNLIPVTIELGPRGREVVDYALAQGITVEDAVVRLMNSGLSHLPWKESSNAYVPDYGAKTGIANPFRPGDIVEVGDWTKAYRQGKRRGRVMSVEDNLVAVCWPDNTAPTTFAFGDLKFIRSAYRVQEQR